MRLSVTLIPASGFYCSYMLWLLRTSFVINLLFSFCISRSVAQFNLFLVNRHHLLSRTDNWKIGDSLGEFKDKIVLCALAAQDSLTENLTRIWMTKQVQNIGCVQHGAASSPKVDPTWHWILLEKSSSDPPLKLEKWQMQEKSTFPAKDHIVLDTLLEPELEKVHLPIKTIYECTITGSSAQLERERLASMHNWKWTGRIDVTKKDRGHE